jgi:DNA-binding response OmpR family regulator
MRILLVDDYPGLCELYDLALAARGIEVVSAATAGEAITLAASQSFDAVVLDVQLPDGSGPQLLARLRCIPSLAHASFVGISGDAPAAVKEGFDAFLDKPFHPKRLASVLRRLRVAAGKIARAS